MWRYSPPLSSEVTGDPKRDTVNHKPVPGLRNLQGYSTRRGKMETKIVIYNAFKDRFNRFLELAEI